MPNISASDYTTFLKFKAAAASPIRPDVQTRTNAALSQSVLNANILASQAAFITTPYNTTVFPSPTTISAVSSQTVTAARRDILSSVAPLTEGSNHFLVYTSSQPHGLNTGDVISVTGFGGTVFPPPNITSIPIIRTSDTEFRVASIAGSGTSTGTGSITGRSYYTTSVAHGLVPGQVISVTGTTSGNANLTNATVISVPSATTFVVANTITAVSGQTGTIVGRVYYTTAAAHGLLLTRSDQFVTVSGITGTTAFNVAQGSIVSVPSATVFVMSGTTVGSATSQSGSVTVTTLFNPNVSIRGNVRVQGQPPNTVNNPNALSTLSWTSGTSGSVPSTKFQQPGGLPAKNVVGTYTRLPQKAGW